MAFGTMEYNKEVECGEKEGGGKGGKEGRYKCGQVSRKVFGVHLTKPKSFIKQDGALVGVMSCEPYELCGDLSNGKTP